MLEYAQAEGAECHGRQGRIQRTDEVLVEPLGFFDLKAYPRDRGEILLGEVNDETDAEVVQPCKAPESATLLHRGPERRDAVDRRRRIGSITRRRTIF